jgi:hypothetical protein
VSNPISLKMVVDLASLREDAERIGTTLRAGIGNGLRGVDDEVSKLEQSLQRLERIGGMRQLESSFTGIHTKLSSIGGMVNGIGDSFLRLSAMTYVFDRIGTAIERGIISPFERVAQAGDNAMRFRQQISGTVGGMDVAGGVDRAMIQRLGDLPMTLEQARRVTEELSKVGALSGAFSQGSSSEVAQRISGYTTTVGNLQSLVPWQTPDKIAHSIGTALEGNSLGRLRMTVGVNPDDLARLAGTNQKDLASDPAALMDALGKYAAQ